MSKVDDKSILQTLERDIYPVLSDKILFKLKMLGLNQIDGIEEIRLRGDRPLAISKDGQEYFIYNNGDLTRCYQESFLVTKHDIEKTLQLMCNYSIYSIEEELKQGFLTLQGAGVGISGRCVLEGKTIKTIKNVSGMNIRIAREVKDCGRELVESIFNQGIKHTLIASPPGCGKTTLLRDIIRILSNGDVNFKKRGYKIGVVDERSEIAGCYLGIPQRDVGVRTDVLDACPKVQGMIMLLRSMSPEIIAVDEIGSIDDAETIETAINSGVKVIATVHGQDMRDVILRPGIKMLMDKRCFEKIVFLSRRNGPGTIEKIISI